MWYEFKVWADRVDDVGVVDVTDVEEDVRYYAEKDCVLLNTPQMKVFKNIYGAEVVYLLVFID